MARRRAYLIYECAQGWCLEPSKADIVRAAPAETMAFSRLPQLLWFLQKHVKASKNVDANLAQATQTPPAKERDETRSAVKAVA